MRIAKTAPVVGLMSFALLIAACGGDDSSTDEPGGTVETEVTLLGLPGTWEPTFADEVIPLFEEETGIEVTLITGQSGTANAAKVIAERNNPEVDVMITNDSGLLQAKRADVAADIDPDLVPNAGSIYDILKDKDGKAAAQGVGPTGIAYNTKVFEANNWDPPTSWYDLWDPKFEGKVVVNTCSNFNCYAMVPFLAELESGDPEDLDAAFEKLAEIKPNLVAVAASQAQLEDMLKTEAAWVASSYAYSTYTLKNQGAPLGFVYPEEGSIYFTNQYVITKGAPHPGAAAKFVDFLLSSEVQAIIAKVAFLGPSNSETELTPEVSANVAYGPEQIAQLKASDWELIDKNLQEITDRWAREIEQ